MYHYASASNNITTFLFYCVCDLFGVLFVLLQMYKGVIEMGTYGKGYVRVGGDNRERHSQETQSRDTVKRHSQETDKKD